MEKFLLKFVPSPTNNELALLSFDELATCYWLARPKVSLPETTILLLARLQVSDEQWPFYRLVCKIFTSYKNFYRSGYKSFIGCKKFYILWCFCKLRCKISYNFNG